MKNKTQRLAIIRKLIEKEAISSQEELLGRLKEQGVDATQSTLSRDLKSIRVVKVPHETKGNIYVITDNASNLLREEKLSSLLMDTLLSVDFSGNIAILRTLPGYANAVSALIDGENYFEILGTIAGDDTIFVAIREGVNHTELLNALSNLYADINSLFKQ